MDMEYNENNDMNNLDDSEFDHEYDSREEFADTDDDIVEDKGESENDDDEYDSTVDKESDDDEEGEVDSSDINDGLDSITLTRSQLDSYTNIEATNSEIDGLLKSDENVRIEVEATERLINNPLELEAAIQSLYPTFSELPLEDRKSIIQKCKIGLTEELENGRIQAKKIIEDYKRHQVKTNIQVDDFNNFMNKNKDSLSPLYVFRDSIKELIYETHKAKESDEINKEIYNLFSNGLMTMATETFKLDAKKLMNKFSKKLNTKNKEIPSVANFMKNKAIKESGKCRSRTITREGENSRSKSYYNNDSWFGLN